MVLHWLLRIMKQNDTRYNRRNHRCCKPCLYQVPISLQCSKPDDGHRSCSAWSCISSTQLQGGNCDPWRNLASRCRTRPCLPHRQKGTWCIEGIHEWCPVSSGLLIHHDTDADKFRKGMKKTAHVWTACIWYVIKCIGGNTIRKCLYLICSSHCSIKF